MEKLPFDGFVFHVCLRKGGRKVNFAWECFGKTAFEREDFRGAEADLAAARFERLTDRFLRFNVTPGIDWWDDAQWPPVLGNARAAAGFARASGCRGGMFDVEDYGTNMFRYARHPRAKEKTFGEFRAKVRERGRDLVRAIDAEFPEITLLLSVAYSVAYITEDEKDREDATYGLLPDFLDGILEACDPRTRLIDGWEQAYPYRKAAEFEEAYRTIVETGPRRSAVPEKYRAHVTAAFGIWMDYDWRKKGWSTSDPWKNYFSPPAFEESVRAALRRSDRYVWIYTEKPRWWTGEELPPAYVEVLRKAREGWASSAPEDGKR